MKRILGTLILATGLALPVLAAPSWVVAARQRGTLQSRLSGSENWSRIVVNRRLGFGDSARTGEDSAAQIVFPDGSLVRMGPTTTVRISEAAAELARRGTQVELENGSVQARVTHLRGATQHFEVRTPHAVLAAQGTDFLVEARESTQVAVLQGAVRMTGGATGDSVLLRAGDTGRVEASGEVLINPIDFSLPQATSSFGLQARGRTGQQARSHGTVYESESGETGFDSHRLSDGRGDDYGEFGEQEAEGFMNPHGQGATGGLLIRIPHP